MCQVLLLWPKIGSVNKYRKPWPNPKERKWFGSSKQTSHWTEKGNSNGIAHVACAGGFLLFSLLKGFSLSPSGEILQ